jgi:hypothetical protein
LTLFWIQIRCKDPCCCVRGMRCPVLGHSEHDECRPHAESR